MKKKSCQCKPITLLSANNKIINNKKQIIYIIKTWKASYKWVFQWKGVKKTAFMLPVLILDNKMGP